jgi:hypothetical protein
MKSTSPRRFPTSLVASNVESHLTRNEFIDALKQAIPPVNGNVDTNHRAEDSGDPRFGVSEATFASCAWGLFVPAAPGDCGMFAAGETLFLLDLYTLVFSLPLFYLKRSRESVLSCLRK